MSVNSLKTQTEELQAMYTAFKTGYQTHLETTTDYENRFMNAFEDFSCFIAKGMRDLTSIIDKHIELVSKIQEDHEKNKFEEGNFNKVSLIKKQDTTIRQLEIKVAELESKLAAKTGGSNSITVSPSVQPDIVVTPETTLIQCCARVGKAKYNISKQDAEFMNDFPTGTYITKTGCVVGLACPNMINAGQVFCQDHNNGKFEDIRLEPGTTPVIDIPVAEKKGKSRKQPAKKQDTEPAVIPEPVVTEPAVIPEPVIPEPVVTEPAVITEPVIPEPVIPEPVVTEPAVIIPEPVVTEPVVTEPVVTEPAVIIPEPVVTEPAVTEPVIPAKDIDDKEFQNIQVTEDDIDTEPEVVKSIPVTDDRQNNLPPPEFDDIEFYEDPSNNRTYYLDSKTKRIFEIAPNDEIGLFVRFL